MLCFICYECFVELKLLVDHLKKEHDLTPSSSFRCYESSCAQIFKNLSSYKKHIKRHIMSEIPEQNHSSVFEAHVSYDDVPLTPSNPGISSSFVPPNPTDNEEHFNLDIEIQNFSKNVLQFLINLHANSNFSRKDVNEIKSNVVLFIVDPFLKLLKNYTSYEFHSNNRIINGISSLTSQCKNIFKEIGTEHLLNKKLMNIGCMSEANEFIINSEVEPKHKKGELVYAENIVTGVLLPLRLQFQKFFENQNILIDTLNYMDSLTSSDPDNFTNFIQGPIWKKKCELYPGKLLIPYFLYADDFELNNALGSHSTTHSVCNFYYSFLSLPKKSTQLNNIFLAAVIKSKDLKAYGNEKCLKYLIEEMIYLEEKGIEIKTRNNTYQIHFIVGLILGDNLGLNSILGFVKSFSGTFCRLCRAEKKQTVLLCKEDPNIMRDFTNYNNDVQLQDKKKTGIINECCFNKIKSFHVVENFSADAMHDIFEGVCHYDLCQIIKYYTTTVAYLTLDQLNKRKQQFEYGVCEIGNISPEIDKSHLKKTPENVCKRDDDICVLPSSYDRRYNSIK